MSRRQLALAFLVICPAVCCAERSHAQRPAYRPARPTISRYFDLYRYEPGPLGGYLSDFLPRQELRRELARQAAGLQLQGAAIRAMDERISLSNPSRTAVRPTGLHSTFMNYSHYYPMAGSRSRR